MQGLAEVEMNRVTNICSRKKISTVIQVNKTASRTKDGNLSQPPKILCGLSETLCGPLEDREPQVGNHRRRAIYYRYSNDKGAVIERCSKVVSSTMNDGMRGVYDSGLGCKSIFVCVRSQTAKLHCS